MGNALHMTQGAVSQQTARLESALDCVLFIRSRRGHRLTPHGERLIGQARRYAAELTSGPDHERFDFTIALLLDGLLRRCELSRSQRPCRRPSRCSAAADHAWAVAEVKGGAVGAGVTRPARHALILQV
ncbi:LysR family transcriptional regulator [Streptomyces asiaticus]|uniref:LysR family transcriptional regulator n=1 Tax=Streptomyces asiaticus TaxID=114695 RepID=UPI0039BE6BA5